MSDLPLVIKSQTNSKITFTYPKVDGADGYRYYAAGKAVARTFDPNDLDVTFGKGQEPYRVVPLDVSERADGFVYPAPVAPPPPPPSTGVIPAFSVRLTPNWISSQDAASSNYQVVWVYPKSPTTPYLSPDSQKQVTRYLLLDPRYKDAQGIAGKDEWWFLIERYWPSSFDPSQHGKWGRECNFHNVAGDAGPTGSGGVGWSFGSGVSALGLDWLASAPSPTISVMTAYRSEGGFDIPLPVPTRDAWHTYLIHWVAGRTDGTTLRPGAITVWADGGQVVDKQNLNTVQRAKGPDGNYYVQRWMTLWEGDYTQDLPAPSEKHFALTRIGNTLSECLADRPVKASDNVGTMYYRGTGTNLGAPTLTALADRDPNAAVLPVL